MAGGPLSKTQLDKLGDRLRSGSRDEADIRSLNEYRQSFRPAFESDLDAQVREQRLTLERELKSIAALIEQSARRRREQR